MESTKINKGKHHKKSLFMCFKIASVVDDDDNSKSQRRKHNKIADPVLAYLSAADEDGVVLSSTAEKEECGNHRQKKGKDTWHTLRMAFKDTSLMKKILNKKKTKKESISRSNTNTESEITNKLKPTYRTTSNTSSNIANSSTIFSCSSSSLNSTPSSYHDHMSNTSSHELNTIPKPPLSKATTSCGVTKKISFIEDKKKRNIALCMLWIISLLVLILWGKFFAILCTSIWFYLVPFRGKCKEGVGLFRESEFDSVQYKKKIIMEGILERSHSRASLLNSASSTNSMTKS